jgi:ABC-type transport system substrate-binding protein
MRPRLVTLSAAKGLLILILFIASCAPKVDSVPTAIPTPTQTPVPPSVHAPEIRFALIGSPRSTINVWELFDEAGTSYADRAVRSEYWPRLYHLSLPDLSFQPLAAQGMPSEVTQDGDYYSATVTLRTDLTWTDGSHFTAEDVAFTVNTSLAFELGADWESSYQTGLLDHAEAVDDSTVKFYFRHKPGVGAWQYGALQGVIVQKSYWEPLIQKALSLLPDDALRTDIQTARDYVARVQTDADRLGSQLAELKQNGGQDRKLDGDYRKKLDELNFAKNSLDRALQDYENRVQTAQNELFSLGNENEPLLGTWLPSSRDGGSWTNEANPAFPFGQPHFDRAVYFTFSDEASAVSAFQNGLVDSILTANGAPQEAATGTVSTYNARFLVVNPQRAHLLDTSFRRALSCMIDRSALADEDLQGYAFPLDSFALSPQWHNPEAKDPCSGMDRSARITNTVKILRGAGYSWAQTPDADHAGSGLVSPDGGEFPRVYLLTPSQNEDPLRYSAAKFIAEQAQYLGVPFSVIEESQSNIVYAVFSSGQYDMALVGWRLSEYPSYMCEWFNGETPALYSGTRYGDSCAALSAESNLEAARQASFQIEADLMSNVPFIPLFGQVRTESIQHLIYPSTFIPNGWGSYYGAPSYAAPAQ